MAKGNVVSFDKGSSNPKAIIYGKLATKKSPTFEAYQVFRSSDKAIYLY